MTRLFSTQFPLNEEKSLEDMLQVVKDWIITSKYNPYTSEELNKLQERKRLSKEGYHISTASYKDERIDTLGIKFIVPEITRYNTFNHKNWITEIVGTKKGRQFWTSVVLDLDSEKPFNLNLKAKKPMIVSKLVELLGGGDDGEVEVKNTPHMINPQFDYLDVNMTALMLNSNSRNSLPIVYLSCDDAGNYKINPNVLAYKLSGLAHVIVEPTRPFSYQLRKELNGRDVYNGLIGVYWPASNSVWKISEKTLQDKNYHLKNNDQMSTEQLLTEYIYESIANALVHQKIRSELCYSTIDNLTLRQQIRQARERIGEMSQESEITKEQLVKEMSEIQELYDQELESKDKEILDKERSIKYLENQLITSQNNVSTKDGEKIIQVPEGMTQFYNNEITDIIIESLNEKAQGISNTRKKAILELIIKQNPISKNRKEILDNIKKVFSNYTGMNNKTLQDIRKLGFDIEEDGKHYKVKHIGCDNFYVTIAKTPGDRRCGENIYKTIKHTFF